MRTISSLFLLIILCLLSVDAVSQNSYQIKIYYGYSNGLFQRNVQLVGSGSIDLVHHGEFGLLFEKSINNTLGIETGINYFRSKVTIHAAPMYPPIPDKTEEFGLLSVPVYAHQNFWEYFFINAGPIIDIQITKNNFDTQSGIGLGMGLGGQYEFQHFSVFLNPLLKIHRIVSFGESKTHPLRFIEAGGIVGIGYRF